MAAGGDYPDNAARFTLLGRAVLEAIRAEARPVDVIHGHDWQAGPALLSLRHRYDIDPLLARSVTMLTCHNLAYHGWTPRDQAWQLDLPASVGYPEGVDLLREAIYAADIVNTVSPTYARESLTPAVGRRPRTRRCATVATAISASSTASTPHLWDPATDPVIAATYDAADLSGKAQVKAELVIRHGLDAGGPLLGVVGRLDPQKGFDLVAAAGAGAHRDGRPTHRPGHGQPGARGRAGGALAGATRTASAVLDRFDRDEARRIYAGSDLFLMPSRFEPCGQGQLIAMRYGTPPVVRRVGGLADTVVDADDDPRAGTGFVFGPADPGALVEAVRRAIAAYADEPRFRRIQAQGMARDNSWTVPARQYEMAYQRAIAG